MVNKKGNKKNKSYFSSQIVISDFLPSHIGQLFIFRPLETIQLIAVMEQQVDDLRFKGWKLLT